MSAPRIRLAEDGHYYIGRYRIAPDGERHARFYLDHPALELPHRHACREISLHEVGMSCDACGRPVPRDELHGTIVDHARCIEVRVVSACVQCPAGPDRLLHNILRFDQEGELTFQRDGEWVRTTTWWGWLRHRLGF